MIIVERMVLVTTWPSGWVDTCTEVNTEVSEVEGIEAPDVRPGKLEVIVVMPGSVVGEVPGCWGEVFPVCGVCGVGVVGCCWGVV